MFKGEVNNRTEEMSSASIYFKETMKQIRRHIENRKSKEKMRQEAHRKGKKWFAKHKGDKQEFHPKFTSTEYSRYCYHMARMKRNWKNTCLLGVTGDRRALTTQVADKSATLVNKSHEWVYVGLAVRCCTSNRTTLTKIYYLIPPPHPMSATTVNEQQL